MTGTLLLIDDDALGRTLLQKTLEHEGYHVRTASDGAEGSQAARAERADLILLDLDMPGVSGWDAILILRSDPLTAGVPVVAYTAEHLDTAGRERLRELGFDAYLPKGVAVQELVREIRRLTGTPPDEGSAGYGA